MFSTGGRSVRVEMSARYVNKVCVERHVRDGFGCSFLFQRFHMAARFFRKMISLYVRNEKQVTESQCQPQAWARNDSMTIAPATAASGIFGAEFFHRSDQTFGPHICPVGLDVFQACTAAARLETHCPALRDIGKHWPERMLAFGIHQHTVLCIVVFKWIAHNIPYGWKVKILAKPIDGMSQEVKKRKFSASRPAGRRQVILGR